MDAASRPLLPGSLMRFALVLVLATASMTSCQAQTAPVPTGDDCEWSRPAGEPSQFTLGGSNQSGVAVADG